MARWLRSPTTTSLHLDGSSVDLGDTRFTVCPWWDGPVTREEVAAQLAAAAVDRPGALDLALPRAAGRDAAVQRRAPDASPTRSSPTGSREPQPDLVFCGHIHQAPWIDGGTWHARLGDTWVFNAGKQIGKVPPHITVDTDAGTAHWFGVFESETVSLSEPRASRAQAAQWLWWSPSGSRAEPVRVAGPWWCTSRSRIWSTMPEVTALRRRTAS